MATKREVSGELDRLEQVQKDLAAVSSRTDPERARDLIRLRRELSQQIRRMGHVAEGYFEAKGDAQAMQQFRERFSTMRSRAATHQADWPAVRLDEADESYHQSARAVREANRAFVAWMRQVLA
jgi:hypothetical protein